MILFPILRPRRPFWTGENFQSSIDSEPENCDRPFRGGLQMPPTPQPVCSISSKTGLAGLEPAT
ncbi:MAG: hypothetical protein ACP5D7_13650 [Limnospira sp.]